MVKFAIVLQDFLYKELGIEQEDTENTINFFVPIQCNI